MTKFVINGIEITQKRSFIIAEIAQAHDGSLGMAHAYIDAVANAGVDAVKFQTHLADAESTIDEAFRVHFSYEDKTRYDYWKRMEFTEEQWVGLKQHATDKGLVFISSAFSVEAVELLERVGMPVWKIASGEVETPDLLDRILRTGSPLLISSGMSTENATKHIVSACQKSGVDFALMQCTSKYPTPLEEVGINVLSDYREQYQCPVGLSDHSGQTYPSLLAMAHKTELIEVHATFSRDTFGPDTAASLTIDEINGLCTARDAFAKILNSPLDKETFASSIASQRTLFGKSLALTKDCDAGTVITRQLLTLKKPGSGIPYSKIDEIIGKTLTNSVPCNRLLKTSDIGMN